MAIYNYLNGYYGGGGGGDGIDFFSMAQTPYGGIGVPLGSNKDEHLPDVRYIPIYPWDREYLYDKERERDLQYEWNIERYGPRLFERFGKERTKYKDGQYRTNTLYKKKDFEDNIRKFRQETQDYLRERYPERYIDKPLSNRSFADEIEEILEQKDKNKPQPNQDLINYLGINQTPQIAQPGSLYDIINSVSKQIPNNILENIERSIEPDIPINENIREEDIPAKLQSRGYDNFLPQKDQQLELRNNYTNNRQSIEGLDEDNKKDYITYDPYESNRIPKNNEVRNSLLPDKYKYIHGDTSFIHDPHGLISEHNTPVEQEEPYIDYNVSQEKIEPTNIIQDNLLDNDIQPLQYKGYEHLLPSREQLIEPRNLFLENIYKRSNAPFSSNFRDSYLETKYNPYITIGQPNINTNESGSLYNYYGWLKPSNNLDFSKEYAERLQNQNIFLESDKEEIEKQIQRNRESPIASKNEIDNHKEEDIGEDIEDNIDNDFEDSTSEDSKKESEDSEKDFLKSLMESEYAVMDKYKRMLKGNYLMQMGLNAPGIANAFARQPDLAIAPQLQQIALQSSRPEQEAVRDQTIGNMNAMYARMAREQNRPEGIYGMLAQMSDARQSMNADIADREHQLYNEQVKMNADIDSRNQEMKSNVDMRNKEMLAKDNQLRSEMFAKTLSNVGKLTSDYQEGLLNYLDMQNTYGVLKEYADKLDAEQLNTILKNLTYLRSRPTYAGYPTSTDRKSNFAVFGTDLGQ